MADRSEGASPLPEPAEVKRHRTEGGDGPSSSSLSPRQADSGDDLPDSAVPPPARQLKEKDPDVQQRWSDGKFFNPYVPSYIPPEFIIFNNGKPLEAFLRRVQLEDARRMSERAEPEPFFRRKYGHAKVDTRYDADGNLVSSFKQAMRDRREHIARILTDEVKRNNRETTRRKEIIRKIYFTQEQIEAKSYGAIFGSRGQTHKMLVQETGCQIVLAGRGITKVDARINQRNYERAVEMANEPPHCRVVAPSETALQAAVEKIEWLLSDSPEATRFRDKMRMQLAKDNGVYNAADWVGGAPAQIAGGPASAGGAGGGAPKAITGQADDDLEEIFRDMEGSAAVDKL